MTTLKVPKVELDLAATRYAVEDDLTGGWAISKWNKPVSEHNILRGEVPDGNFMFQEMAEHLVEQHNQWLYYTELL